MRAWNGIERACGLPYPVWGPASVARLVDAIRRADVVHVHDYLYFGSLVAIVAARLLGKPLLVTQHIGPVPLDNPLLRRAVSLANRALGAPALRGADRVVFIGDSVRGYFEGFARFRRAPLLVPNGVDHEVFAPVDDARRRALRGELGLADDDVLLLYVGRFVDKKGLPMLRALAERTPRLRWALAGWGPVDPVSWGLPNLRVFAGLSGRTLAPLYQSADLLLLPSASEGFALVIQEAMACGTPCLVSDPAAEGCPDAAGLLMREPVVGDDARRRWSSRVERLAGDRSALAAARPAVAAFARERWSWAGCAARYAALLREAVDQRRQGSA